MAPSDVTVELIQPETQKQNLPAVLTIAGSDSSGGAGIEADIKTFTSHNVYGLTCITALTAQNTLGVRAIVNTPKEHMSTILDLNFADFVEGYTGDHPLKVVKTGMLTDEAAELLSERVDYLRDHNIKLVMDPVMVSTSGSKLAGDSTLKLCLEAILPSTYLCTPNFVESEHLWKSAGGGEVKVDSVETFKQFAVDLQRKLKCKNILVKGGHIPWLDGHRFDGDVTKQAGLEIVDVLYQSEEDAVTTFKSPFIYETNSHGTGCTLASSISANLAKGNSLEQSVILSIHYIHMGMVSLKKKLGHGTGPLNHTVKAESSVRNVIRGKNYHSIIKESHGSLLQYFKTHDIVRENWRKYTEHDFVLLLATNSLPFDKFLYFLKQDFYYLVNYAQVHGLAASVAPDCKQIHAQSAIIDNIMKEILRHKEKLLKVYNVDYDNCDLDDELKPAASCIAYCDYLMKIGKNEDFLGIKVALAPCLHGYAEAGVFGAAVRASHDGALNLLDTPYQAEAYSSWLDDYNSDWYREAHHEGEVTLDAVFAEHTISEQRMDELTKIFNDVVCLEVGFWDEITRDLNATTV